MLLYIILALGAYFLSELVRPISEGSLMIILGLNTIILLLYLGVIYALERKTIQQMLKT